ncbi:MAG: AAA family ATPase, partial [Candidatus Doudnabacteria bacterium]|nr:AAA family ATPase [Candidatus Doudnabacteria bacterium]
MSSKPATQFVCSNCGFITSRWQGKCSECNEWNTLAEQRAPASRKGGVGVGSGKVEQLSEVMSHHFSRLPSGLAEFDLVLGGGLVPGALVLIGGDPGVGKSTLALQTALMLAAKDTSVLYVSGEESAQQIQLRSKRMAEQGDLAILSETNLEIILETLELRKPAVAVIDSIQTISSIEVNGVVGGVSQVAYATNAFMRLAKALHITILI